MRKEVNFDEVLHRENSNLYETDYGIFHGNNTIVFLKTGNGGSCYGYQDKYLRLAFSIWNKYGYTVMISSKPVNARHDLKYDFLFMEEYAKTRCLDNIQVYFIGVSEGAKMGAKDCFLHQYVKRMLLINGPLLLDFNETIKGMLSFRGERLDLVYGSEDPSYPLVHFVPDMIKANPIIHLKVLEGQNHFLSKNGLNLFDIVKETLFLS